MNIKEIKLAKIKQEVKEKFSEIEAFILYSGDNAIYAPSTYSLIFGWRDSSENSGAIVEYMIKRFPYISLYTKSRENELYWVGHLWFSSL